MKYEKQIQIVEVLFDMVAYELYSFDEKNGVEFIGVLPERRKDPKRITKESIVNWGKMILGNHADGKKIFFKRVTLDDIIGGAFGINISLSNY